jgi:hypothetical protein
MISVLTIRAKFRGFKPGWGDGILRATKIRSTSFFGGEIKPSSPCRKSLWHVKNHLQVWTKLLCKVKFIIILSRSSSLQPNDTTVRIYGELWWTNQEFFSVDIISPWFFLLILIGYITWEWTIGPLVAAVDRRSLIPSTRSSASSCRP